jgi:uncharacterized cupredoxin-like copper-binding protein
MLGTSDLPIGLAPIGDSPYGGTALLHDDGDGTTTVSVILTKGSAAGPDSATPEAAGQTVKVALGDFSVSSSAMTFKVGQTYTFVANNTGKATHELVIERSTDVDKPLEENGSTAEAEDVAPGETKTLTSTFTQPGQYQLACHQPGHFEAGMKTEIAVEP